MNTTEILTQALTEGRTVSLNYDNKQRIVEVHAIGTSTKDGKTLARCYQVAGEASRPLPAWSLFVIDKIDAPTIGFDKSLAPRPGYAMNDKQLAKVIAQIDLKEAA